MTICRFAFHILLFLIIALWCDCLLIKTPRTCHSFHRRVPLSTRLYCKSSTPDDIPSTPRRSPRLEIEYCVGCRWMLRSAYLAQEVLSTFEKGNVTIKEVSLVPQPDIAGTFIIRLDEQVIWDRKIDNGFPDAKQLKQRIRDKIDPTRSLGHSDVKVVEVKE